MSKKACVRAAVKSFKEKQREGKLQGYAPFGYYWKSYPEKRYLGKRINKKADLLIDEEKAQILKSVFELFSTNHFNFVTISDEIYKKYSINLTDEQINYFLKNQFYNGYLKNGVRHHYSRIISDEIFNTVQEILKIRKKLRLYKRSKNVYKYSGLLSCYFCKTFLVRQKLKKRTFYRCFGYKSAKLLIENHRKRNFYEDDLDVEFKFLFEKIFSENIISQSIPNTLKIFPLSIENNQRLFKMLFKEIYIDNNFKFHYEFWSRSLFVKKSEMVTDLLHEDASILEKILYYTRIPQTIDSLAELLNVDIQTIQSTLIDLQIEKKIEQTTAGDWKNCEQ